MFRLVNAAGDRLLGLLLGSVEAGACVPEIGQVCCTKRYTCTGACVCS